jgi:predicted ABC-type sugar transport system permease subunit
LSETTAQGTSDVGTQEPGFGERLLAVLVRVREVSVLIVALGLVFYFQAANPAFLSESNILSLARFAVPYVVIASALCLLLICGELDLSRLFSDHHIGNVLLARRPQRHPHRRLPGDHAGHEHPD